MNAQEAFQKLFAVENIDGLEPEAALEYLGRLIDVSLDLRRLDGTQRAIQLAEALQGRKLSSPHASQLHYFLSNAWATLGLLSRTGPDAEWAWEQPEFEKQIVHLRLAIRENGFQQLTSGRQAQVFTNLGNLFSEVGRFIEAQECWNEALTLQPRFGMALGNRGGGDCGTPMRCTMRAIVQSFFVMPMPISIPPFPFPVTILAGRTRLRGKASRSTGTG